VGPDRAAALTRLDDTLVETAVLGVRTNIAVLRALCTDPEVVAGSWTPAWSVDG